MKRATTWDDVRNEDIYRATADERRAKLVIVHAQSGSRAREHALFRAAEQAQLRRADVGRELDSRNEWVVVGMSLDEVHALLGDASEVWSKVKANANIQHVASKLYSIVRFPKEGAPTFDVDGPQPN